LLKLPLFHHLSPFPVHTLPALASLLEPHRRTLADSLKHQQGIALQTNLLHGMESHLGVKQPGDKWRGAEDTDALKPKLATGKTTFEMVDVEAVSVGGYWSHSGFPLHRSPHSLTRIFPSLPSPLTHTHRATPPSSSPSCPSVPPVPPPPSLVPPPLPLPPPNPKAPPPSPPPVPAEQRPSSAI